MGQRLSRTKACLLAVLVITNLGLASSGFADETYTVTVKKQPEPSKDIRRWSLQEFLDTKDRMRLMDLWLALHTPKPYEFFLNADARFVENPTAPWDYRLSFSAFASIFGLSVEGESIPSKVNLLFLLRVFGFREQATHLTLHVGLRSQADPLPFRSAFLGISSALYFTKYFGFEAMYRHYYAGVPTITASTYEGFHFEGNAFMDFSALRIFGGYLRQTDDQMSRVGFLTGLRVFF